MTPVLNWRELETLVRHFNAQCSGMFVERVIIPARPRFPGSYLKGEWALRLTSRETQKLLYFSVRGGRLLQQYLRTVSPRQEWRGAFQPPVDVPPVPSFGSPQTYAGMAAVESRMDAIHGEYHRGLDYDVAPGTMVKAPAAGTVLFSGTLALSGRTVVVDHGLGLLSVFSHLAEAGVRQGEWLDTGRTVGTSGETGIAAAPHLHWAVYLLGVAIDPRVTERL